MSAAELFDTLEQSVILPLDDRLAPAPEYLSPIVKSKARFVFHDSFWYYALFNIQDLAERDALVRLLKEESHFDRHQAQIYGEVHHDGDNEVLSLY